MTTFDMAAPSRTHMMNCPSVNLSNYSWNWRVFSMSCINSITKWKLLFCIQEKILSSPVNFRIIFSCCNCFISAILSWWHLAQPIKINFTRLEMQMLHDWKTWALTQYPNNYFWIPALWHQLKILITMQERTWCTYSIQWTT